MRAELTGERGKEEQDETLHASSTFPIDIRGRIFFVFQGGQRHAPQITFVSSSLHVKQPESILLSHFSSLVRHTWFILRRFKQLLI